MGGWVMDDWAGGDRWVSGRWMIGQEKTGG